MSRRCARVEEIGNGRITLKGYVVHQCQRDAAYSDVASLYGVYDITDEIKVDGL
jgi:osmotically-inducible protein OsmY